MQLSYIVTFVIVNIIVKFCLKRTVWRSQMAAYHFILAANWQLTTMY